MSSTTEAVRLAAHAPARALTCIALRVGAHTLWHKPRQQALRGRLHACAGMHVCRLRAGEHACLPSRHRTACLHCLLTRRGLARLDTTPYPVQAQGPGRACLRGLPALRRPRTHTRGYPCGVVWCGGRARGAVEVDACCRWPSASPAVLFHAVLTTLRLQLGRYQARCPPPPSALHQCAPPYHSAPQVQPRRLRAGGAADRVLAPRGGRPRT